MNQDLSNQIQQIKKNREGDQKSPNMYGYNIAVVMLTDLLGCILVGLAIGLFFQKFFHTSALLTAGMTFLGGIAGVYTVIRFAIQEDKGTKKK